MQCFLWIFLSSVVCVCLLYCLVCFLYHCGHLLGKGWPLSSFVCDVFLYFCHFPIWCPGSGVFFIVLIPDLCTFLTFTKELKFLEGICVFVSLYLGAMAWFEISNCETS